PAEGDPLPFDLARAHALYKGLFGEVEDLIKGRHLIIVPSGPLSALPFQVLVHALPAGSEAGAVQRPVGRLGAEVGPLKGQAREGLAIIRVSPDGPAATSGVRPGDLLLRIGGEAPSDVGEALQTIQTYGAHTPVVLHLLRDGRPLEITVTLGLGL